MSLFWRYLGVPFGFLLRIIYDTVGFQNYAVSIVLLTLFARLLMIPTTISQQKGMAKTQRIQPKLRRIQTKFAGDQRKIQEETSALYEREGYNPMSAGCAPMAFQFILLFGLIGAIYYPLSHFLTGISDAEIKLLADAVAKLGDSAMSKSTHLSELLIIQNIDKLQGIPGVSQATYDAIAGINFDFFGLFSLGDIPWAHKGEFHIIWIIPVLSFLSSFATGLYSQIKQKQSNPAMASNPMMTGCMTIFMPLFSLYFVINYPAGIGIYWIASSIFGFLTTVVISHFYNPKKMIARLMIDETVARRSKENNTKQIAANKE